MSNVFRVPPVSSLSSLPRHLQVSNGIKDAIRKHGLNLGDRLPSEQRLADMSCVAVLTVRRALVDLVREGIIEKKIGKGIYIKKTISVAGARIGLTVLDTMARVTSHPAILSLIKGISEVFDQKKYHLEILFITSEMIRHANWSKITNCEGLDGAIVFAQEVPDKIISELRARTKCVVCANRFNQSESPLIAFRAMARELADHLLHLGHQRIALVNGPENIEISGEVFLGYETSLESAGIAVKPEWVGNSDYNHRGGFEWTLKIMKQKNRPTALIMGDDFMALGALDALRQLRLRCPDDVSVVSFNDFDCAKTSAPPLTTMRIDFNKFGQMLARQIAALLEGSEKISKKSLKGKLILRSSSGPVRQ